MTDSGEEPDRSPSDANEQGRHAHTSKFRFKRSRDDETDQGAEDAHSKSRSRRHRHASHRTHRRKPREPPTSSEGGGAKDEQGSQPDAGAAFRESLFDALADDEGADYWEGVYGQPIHIYPNEKPSTDSSTGLERMTDEEYAEYVRARMWEKTHEHILEERRQREEQRRAREEARRAEARSRPEAGAQGNQSAPGSEQEAFHARVAESLRRGGNRREQKAWHEAWAAYIRNWEDLLRPGHGRTAAQVAAAIPWPVRSGKLADVSKEQVGRFFKHAADVPSQSRTLRQLLKLERVRWHPDKVTQRLGASGQSLDQAILRAVTAAFQVIDDLYAES